MSFETFNDNMLWSRAWAFASSNFSKIQNVHTYINSADDFPEAIVGIHTLPAGSYFIGGDIDLNGNRIICDGICSFTGTSSETASITSTGLSGQPLISTEYDIPIMGLTFKDVDIAIAADKGLNPTLAIDWSAVNFVNCFTAGQFGNITNFLYNQGAIINCRNGFQFLIEVDTIGSFSSFYQGTGDSGDLIYVDPAAVINRRIRINSSAIVATGSTIALNVNPSSIPDEAYILREVNFSGGGTYLSGLDDTSNKALFSDCTGIKNTAYIGSCYMLSNGDATVISGIGSPVKVVGDTIENSLLSKFSHTSNRLTYTGSFEQDFIVSSILSLSSSNNNDIGVYIALNGLVIDSSENYQTTDSSGNLSNISVQSPVTLSNGDYIEVWVENNTAVNNITVNNLNTLIRLAG